MGMSTHGSITIMPTSPLYRLRECAYKESISVEGQAPWTTARCQRLLRPLSSKIALLNKLKPAGADKKSREARCESNVQETSNIGGKALNSIKLAKACHAATVRDGAEWEQETKLRKRMRWTYSAKGSAQSTEPEDVYSSVGHVSRKDCLIDMLSQLLAAPSTIEAPFLTSTHEKTDDGGCTESSGTASRKSTRPLNVASGSTRSRGRPCFNAELVAFGESKEERTLHRGIADSMVALFISTKRGNREESRGCRSLFSMCLKRVPHYITEEEQRAMEEDPDHELDISRGVYTELETFATGDNWKPLREVVRAHGVLLIETAIGDGVIKLDAANALVTLCMTRGAYDDAQSILRAIITWWLKGKTQFLTSTESLKDRRDVLKQLRSFTQRTGRTGFLYRQMKYILENDRPWTIDNQLLEDALNGAMQSIVQMAGDWAHAVGFLIAMVRIHHNKFSPTLGSEAQKLRQISRRKPKRTSFRSRPSSREILQPLTPFSPFSQDATSHPAQPYCSDSPLHLSTLIAMISAFAHVHSCGLEESFSAGSKTMSIMLDEMSTEAEQYLELAFLSQGRQNLIPHRQHLYILLVENFLRSSMCHINLGGSLKTMSFGLDTLSRHQLADDDIKQLGSFVNHIARCYGLIRRSHAFGFIETAINVLVESAKDMIYRNETRSLLGKIAVAAAFLFSEGTGQPSHLDWALGVEQSLCSGGSPLTRPALMTPAKTTTQSKSDYRWEEGICEWIAKTPAMHLCQPSTPKSEGCNSNDSDDILTKSTPMTSPDLEAFPFSECSSGDESREKAGLVKRSFGQSYALAKCVRIANDRREDMSNLEGASLKRQRQRTEEETSWSNAVGRDGVYDDTDELSAAQYANDEAATKLPFLDLRGRTHRKPSAVKGTRKLRRKERPGLKVMTKEALGRRTDSMMIQANVDQAVATSDGEDELSFS